MARRSLKRNTSSRYFNMREYDGAIEAAVWNERSRQNDWMAFISFLIKPTRRKEYGRLRQKSGSRIGLGREPLMFEGVRCGEKGSCIGKKKETVRVF